MLLTLITSFYILSSIPLHFWPPKSLSHYSMCSDLPPVWLPQILSCNLTKRLSTFLGWRHNRYSPPNGRQYNLLSLLNQNRAEILWIFSTSLTLLGSKSLDKNAIIGPSNSDQSPRPLRQSVAALYLAFPIPPPRSFEVRNYPWTKPRWIMSQRGCSFPMKSVIPFALWKLANNVPIIFKYSAIRGSLASKLPYTRLTTKWESKKKKIPTTCASSSLIA